MYDQDILYTPLPKQFCMNSEFCNPPSVYYTENKVKDYMILENHRDPGQISLRQNINVKHIRIENNSKKDVLVGICLSGDIFTVPHPQFMLKGGQSKDLGVNMPGERIQYIWLFHPINKKLLNTPHPIRNHINSYTLIEALNNWWIMDFRHKGY